MNSGTLSYPVDRYLVERSNKLEMVNITDDDIWNAEPALRPEDEIMLRKLHDMLQSTADDLKLLSGELSKYHEPGVQVKSLPTPLDDNFNEKVHIEELVNAKFHGYKIVDKSQPTPKNAQRENFNRILKSMPANTHMIKKVIDAGIQVNQMPNIRKSAKSKNLTVTRTKNIQINENDNHSISGTEKHGGQQSEKTNKPTVAYKELSFKYAEPNIELQSSKPLQVQNMPSINIRGELKEQKVLELNIEPKASSYDEKDIKKSNVAVISLQHEPVLISKTVPNTNINYVQHPPAKCSREPIRKFSKMSSGESTEVDSPNKFNFVTTCSRKIKPYRATKIKLPPRHHYEDIKNNRNNTKKEFARHSNSNLDGWKKKLNAVYGCPTSSRKPKSGKTENKAKKTETKSKTPPGSEAIKNSNTLNNAQYIPYSKLTLGGARISDIEKELSGIPNKTDLKLDPILNKILSRENSFNTDSTQGDADEDSPKILTTSDENLLREVLDIGRKVTKTLTKKVNEPNTTISEDQPLNVDGQDSYADDFEDEKSDNSIHSEKQNQLSDAAHPYEIMLDKSQHTDSDNHSLKSSSSSKENIKNKTFTKTANLSLKKYVDIFEYVHNIDTQDTATQSNTTQKISLKETQTSPRHDKSNVQPIHNDLWPSIDPKGEVEKLFQLEKDFIKKLVVDEYGDLLEKHLNKPSTSKINENKTNDEKNVTSFQKNTQTSPAHVKNVMTSPTRTKTRTTSPLTLSLTVDRQTSPIKEELKIIVDDKDDLGLSVNLSSPRFNLQLPQTSREVMSKLECHTQSNRNVTRNLNSRVMGLMRKNAVTSSSSADGDYSSSDISSLGEVRFKLKRFQKLHVPILSDLSSSSSVSKYSSDISDPIIPLRSEGEVSLGQIKLNRRKSYKNIKSEGETSLRH